MAGLSEVHEEESAGRTWLFMGAGLILALVIVAPVYACAAGESWGIDGFPLGWLATGLVYLGVFFHEIGHTVFYWVYGYPSVPSFDFEHGGGIAFGFTRSWFVFAVVAGAIGYGIYQLREFPILSVPLGLLLLLQFGLGFFELHNAAIYFMGHGFELVVASFLLLRAWCNLAPRGSVERMLNAVVGFGMIFNVMIMAHGLINSQTARAAYLGQKGHIGAGDFTKVSNVLDISVPEVAAICFAMAVAALILPFVLYLLRPRL